MRLSRRAIAVFLSRRFVRTGEIPKVTLIDLRPICVTPVRRLLP
jgi:hypothetical protein